MAAPPQHKKKVLAITVTAVTLWPAWGHPSPTSPCLPVASVPWPRWVPARPLPAPLPPAATGSGSHPWPSVPGVPGGGNGTGTGVPHIISLPCCTPSSQVLCPEPPWAVPAAPMGALGPAASVPWVPSTSPQRASKKWGVFLGCNRGILCMGGALPAPCAPRAPQRGAGKWGGVPLRASVSPLPCTP